MIRSDCFNIQLTPALLRKLTHLKAYNGLTVFKASASWHTSLLIGKPYSIRPHSAKLPFPFVSIEQQRKFPVCQMLSGAFLA